MSAHPPGLYARFGKRALDLAILIAFAPVVLTLVAVLAFAVRADGGPAFYSQERVGRGGRVFRIWKLRSMVVNADEALLNLLESDAEARTEWTDTQKLRNDPRVTSIGRWIRKLSLDELPQFWNVVVGEMSLVGPRPFLPEQRSLYPGGDYYELRPGLTGLWQVSERNSTTFAARAEFDSQYHAQVSFMTDLRILLATVAVVVRGTGL